MKKYFLPLILLAFTGFIKAKTDACNNPTTDGNIILKQLDLSSNCFPHNITQSQNLLNKFFLTTILDEQFNNFTDNGWTTYSISGTQAWKITSFGNPAPAASMNGFGDTNEDWLISKNIDLAAGYASASFSFQTDARYTGNPLEVYITTDSYTNGASPSTVTWTKLNAIFDTDLSSFGNFVSSGNIDLTSYLGLNVRIAFKYKNDLSSTATSWELDNFKIIALGSLGVSESFSKKTKFYPNPVKKILNLSEEFINIKIIDVSGNIIYEKYPNGKSIDISNLRKGVYFVTGNTKSGEMITNKIIKE